MKTAKLLLVENDPLLSRLIPVQLTKYGYEVAASVKTGEEAIVKAGELPFDLVLMDIDLDGPMDGITAALEIRRHRDIPVIYSTSHTDRDILQRVRASGATTCLRKPCPEKELALAIEFNLYRYQSEREQKRLRDLLAQVLADGPQSTSSRKEAQAYLETSGAPK